MRWRIRRFELEHDGTSADLDGHGEHVDLDVDVDLDGRAAGASAEAEWGADSQALLNSSIGPGGG